jgi:hypothetical protein
MKSGKEIESFLAVAHSHVKKARKNGLALLGNARSIPILNQL